MCSLSEITYYRNRHIPGDLDKGQHVEHPELRNDNTAGDVVRPGKMASKYRGEWKVLCPEGTSSGTRYRWEKSPGVAKGKQCHAPGVRHQMHTAFLVFAILLACSETKPEKEEEKISSFIFHENCGF